MQVRRLGAAVFVVDVLRNPVHRPRPVQRDERDDVGEIRRLEIDADAAHALGFELKHPKGFAATEHLVRARIIVGDGRQLEGRISRAPDLVGGRLHHREVAQSQEVHLEQTDPFDVTHLVLRVDVAFADSHQRYVFDQRVFGDDDAGGMGRRVPGQAFDRVGRIDEPPDLRVHVVEQFEFGICSRALAIDNPPGPME